MASSTSQRIVKRNFALSPHLIIVIAIVGGIIVLNIVILFAWCTVSRRRSAAKQKQKRALSSEESLPHKRSLSRQTTSRRVSSQYPSHQPPTYMQMMMSLQTVNPRPNVPPSPTYTSAPTRKASIRKPPMVYVLDEGERESGQRSPRYTKVPASPKSQVLPKSPVSPLGSGSGHHLSPSSYITPPQIHRVPSSGRRVGALRRSNSMDSVSVYSSASAPLDAHERIFQPLAFEQVPTAPLPNNLQDNMTSQPSRRTSTQIREELAPETYVRPNLQWRVQRQQPTKPQINWRFTPRPRARTLSESSAVPPIPSFQEHTRAPPPKPLRIVPYAPSQLPYALSERTESTASIDRPSVPPGLEPITIPKPISPLNVRRSVQLNRHCPLAESSSMASTPQTPGAPQLPPRSPYRPTARKHLGTVSIVL